MSELEIIDRLPFGLMIIRGDAITFMNYTLRSLFAQQFGSLTALTQTFPGTATLTSSAKDKGRVWVTIADAVFYVHRIEQDADTMLILLPLRYMDPRDGQLRELRELYEDFQEIFHNCFDGIYVADGNGRTLWLNEGFERAYGLDARDFIGQDARELERLGYIKPPITWKVITTRQRQSAVQRTKAGKSILATGIPLLDKHGNVRKVIINSRDLTEFVELQQRLSETEANLARTQSQLAQLQRESSKVKNMLWSSGAMQAVVDLALRVATVDTTLLIQGESGVGKDELAHLIHAEGARRDAPFVKINCGAIPAELLESEFFGYDRGAFTGARKEGKPGTFELAHQGTLFLDEIGEMPPPLQVKLLQVLQDRVVTRVGGTKPIEVDFRLIAATNCNLKAMVRNKEFREDLFYRLSVIPIEIPPLRQRPEDIIPLAHRFLAEVNERYGFGRRLSGPVMDCMLRYPWPGNVRELRNIIERIAVTSASDELELDVLPVEIRDGGVHAGQESSVFREARRDLEADLVRAAVEQFGSIRCAARHLKISESTVKRKLRASRLLSSE